MKKPTKTKVPPKLSPQEGRIYNELTAAKTNGCRVIVLYRVAKEIKDGRGVGASPRRMQQHVGVLVARLNKKRRRTTIVPGGEHNYILRRRSR